MPLFSMLTQGLQHSFSEARDTARGILSSDTPLKQHTRLSKRVLGRVLSGQSVG